LSLSSLGVGHGRGENSIDEGEAPEEENVKKAAVVHKNMTHVLEDEEEMIISGDMPRTIGMIIAVHKEPVKTMMAQEMQEVQQKKHKMKRKTLSNFCHFLVCFVVILQVECG
jgi:hypothetical protein